MNDNDIILGLKCLADEDEILCTDCAFRDINCGFSCKKNVSKAAIDLIKRLKAEILELKQHIENLELEDELEWEREVMQDDR